MSFLYFDCYPKISTLQIFYLNIIMFHLKQNMFFSLFNSKIWRDTSKTIFLLFSHFCPLLENKNKYLKKFNLKYYFWPLFLIYTYKGGFYKFTKINFILRSLNFLKMKTLPHMGWNLHIVWNLPSNNIIYRQKRVAFWKSQKVLNHSTLQERIFHAGLSKKEGQLELIVSRTLLPESREIRKFCSKVAEFFFFDWGNW